VFLTPSLEVSPYFHPDGVPAAAVEWQVASDNLFTGIVCESGAISPIQTSWTLPADKLEPYKYYWWRARYEATTGIWSNWAAPFYFDTGDQPPNRPLLLSPANGSQNVALTPTLQMGAFSDPDTGDTQASVQWRIASDNAFANIVWDSGENSHFQANCTVPANSLQQYKRYWWQGRYKDSRDAWSDWAAPFYFDTGNRPPDAPVVISPPNGARNVS